MAKKLRFTVDSIANSKVASLNHAVVAAVKKAPVNKYRNKKVVVDGIKIDSKKEARIYGELKLRLKLNEIVFLARQVEFSFHIEGGKVTSYFADFVYIERLNFNLVVADVKSSATRKLPVYRLKKKMMYLQNNIIIKEF